MHYYSVNSQSQSSIPISDRAIAYGDGIFTTAKITNGKVQFISSHMSRLIEGSEYLKINFTQSQTLFDEISRVAKNYSSAVIKIIITAGSGGRGYSRQGVGEAQTIVSIHDFPAHYTQWSQQGVSLLRCDIKLGLNPLLRGLKHLNRLEQVIIRDELDNSPADDFLVCDLNDFVVESSCANVFWMRGDKIYTPDLHNAGVLGVYRKNILSFDQNINLVQEKPDELNDITAMFICNSVMGIIPVNQLNNKALDTLPVVNYRRNLLNHYQDKVC